MKHRVRLDRPSLRGKDEYIAAARRSRRLHRSWAQPPLDESGFREYVSRCRLSSRESYWIRLVDDDALVGVATLSEIVRGHFQNAYLGYYAFVPHAGQGLMREGIALVLREAFGPLKLHRVEANIQPENLASRGLVEALGFRLEGYSPKYLKIGGRWCDHERWAIVADEWRRRKRR